MLPTLRRNYRSPFDVLQREIDDVFNRAWNGDANGDWSIGNYPVDIRATDDSLVVEAELPGFRREEVDITLERGVLCITAQRRQNVENTSGTGDDHADDNGESRRNHLLTERRFARYQRTFTLPTAVDEDNVQARLEDGVLHLTLPKRAEVKPRKIQVN